VSAEWVANREISGYARYLNLDSPVAQPLQQSLQRLSYPRSWRHYRSEFLSCLVMPGLSWARINPTASQLHQANGSSN
jgi:hypothetical protein